MSEEEKAKRDEGLFEDIEIESEQVEVEKESTPTVRKTEETEILPDDLQADTYVNMPAVDETIVLNIIKVVNNPIVEGKNKETGDKFHIGVKKKDGEVIRRDIIAEEGRFTVKNWELFYKLFGSDGVLAKAIEISNRKTFAGVKISITRKYNGNHAMRDSKELMKLMDLESDEAAKAYKSEVAKALKDNKCFEVKLLEPKMEGQ